MVLNRSEEEGYHCIVNLLGKLIEMPVRTSEIPPDEMICFGCVVQCDCRFLDRDGTKSVHTRCAG